MEDLRYRALQHDLRDVDGFRTDLPRREDVVYFKLLGKMKSKSATWDSPPVD